MIIVSNTSPIINLAAIGQLELLKQLYGEIVIPEAVHHEVAIKGFGQAGASEVDKSNWIDVKAVINQTFVRALRLEIDKGEAEAIALAIELAAGLLLLDERKARIIAREFGIHHIGILGILVDAKHKNLIKAVKPFLDVLMVKAGFWISQSLYKRVLLEVEEEYI